VSEKFDRIWQMLYDHESAIYGYIKSSIGDGEAARDLYQDVFLSAVQHLDELDTERSLKNWLYTVTRNRVINYLKSRRKRENIELSDDHQIHYPIDEVDTQMVQRIFARLNPLHRQVLLWHLHEGYSYDEISVMLNRSVSAVTSLIHRARAIFQRLYLLEFLPKGMEKIPDIQDLARFIDPLNPGSDLFERLEKKALAYFSILNRSWDKIRTDFLNEKDLRSILDKISLPQNARVGDMGSGNGFVSLPCATAGFSVYAVDKNRIMADNLMESGTDLGLKNLHILQSDIRSLPFRKKSMDAMFFTLVLHHTANPLEVLIMAMHCLKVNGLLIVVDFLKHYEKDLADTMHDLWMGFDPDLISKHLTKHGADLVDSGSFDKKRQIQSFFQIYRKS
jgi:RNA polymerase sigma factor (sigma-70 family)